MRIKKFQAETIPRAMAQIKRDMGREAVILQIKKKRRPGRFLFPFRQLVEVVAGSDVNVPEQYAPHDQVAAGGPTTVTPETGPIEYQLRIKEMKNELDRLKTNLSRMLAERNIKIKPRFQGRAGVLYQSLLARDVGEELSQRIIYHLKETKSELESEGMGTKRLMLEHFSRKLGQLFTVGGHLDTGRKQRRVVTVIGPTGEGKTTTIAKLAANYSLVMGKKVALISADTYRIAAPEQLKTYAEIIGVPVEVVYTPIELARALEKYQNQELVFIDTAGRSPSNSLHMSELKAYLNAGSPDEVHLVLSATKKLADMHYALDKFKGIDIRSIILTKLDETKRLDSVMNFSYETKKPLSYFGIGQGVPDDIELANTDRFVEFILEGIISDGSGATAA